MAKVPIKILYEKQAPKATYEEFEKVMEGDYLIITVVESPTEVCVCGCGRPAKEIHTRSNMPKEEILYILEKFIPAMPALGQNPN